ncbi:MAG: prepilin-type N-terminal cleavage/methylation domain-containing protein, partial [Bacillota bacterium]|nr:prepilin-type N-terminal cleavage/methylation domain-containing protein [Bacillota bacterium]
MKERLIYNNKKGFTLVELIIVLALIAIVLAGIYTFYFFIQSSYNKNDARSYTNHQINMVFTQLDRD